MLKWHFPLQTKQWQKKGNIGDRGRFHSYDSVDKNGHQQRQYTNDCCSGNVGVEGKTSPQSSGSGFTSQFPDYEKSEMLFGKKMYLGK